MSVPILVLIGILVFLVVSFVRALTDPDHWINEGIGNLFSSYDNSGPGWGEADYTQEDEEEQEERFRQRWFGDRSGDD